MENNAVFERLCAIAKELGADNASVIEASRIELDPVFRDICASNACGMYGKCYACPPDVGDAHALMSDVRTYDYALVYQKIGQLEDSFDFEGMTEAKKVFYNLTQRLRSSVNEDEFSKILHLGAGGCGVCKVCAKKKGEPCRFPHLAIASLEAYCINVSRMANSAGMKYINGQNTVTYFGAVLFNL